jgi:hypothetical protein
MAGEVVRKKLPIVKPVIQEMIEGSKEEVVSWDEAFSRLNKLVRGRN